MAKKSKNKAYTKANDATNGGFANHAVLSPDIRTQDTNVALPNDENVKRARDFVNENEK